MIPASGGFKRRVAVGLAALLFPIVGWAQACGSSSGSSTSASCDNSYRQVQVKCDTHYGTGAPCPKDAMPMKTTGKAPQSFIKDFTPYLFAFARDASDKTRPYAGEWSRGTFGDSSQTFQLVGNSTKDDTSGKTTTRQDACINQIDFDATSPADQAKVVRLQLDNCTNQYILHAAVSPEYRKNPNLLSGENPSDASELISMKTYCQPIKTQTVGTPEYKVGDYLKLAWQKTLTDAPGQTPTIKPHAAFAIPKLNLPPIINQIVQLILKFLLGKFPALNNNAEPHLPSGVTLKNTSDPAVALPASFPDVSQMQIASSQESSGVSYEMILDPTHPYSPRFDYFYNDRDLSNLTSKYESDTSNAVYCAGNRGQPNGGTASSADKIYKVDVLEFRRPAFEKSMVVDRIGFNTACFSDPDTGLTGPIAAVAPLSYCYQVNSPGTATRIPCWKCFGLPPNIKVDDRSQHPPCATRYDRNVSSKPGTIQEDLDIQPQYTPGLLNAGQRNAHCTMNPKDKKVSAASICQVLRRPFVPINLLKMRYHNPGATQADKTNDPQYQQNDELPSGVPEGYAFNDYFRPKGDDNGHMPFPRLWDTGRSIQKNTGMTEQDPMDALGQYTAIVGVGREKGSQNSANGSTTSSGSTGNGSGSTTMNTNDERCMYGGWGGNQSFDGVTVTAPDPITSWTELKLYQARTMREKNLICIGRYEKVFKPRSSEGQLLMRASGEFSTLQICGKDSNGHPTCRNYNDDNQAPQQGENTRREHYIWSPAWRGYLSDPITAQQFPAFGGTAGKGVHTGLDDIQCGDIIMMPKGGGDSSNLGLPKLSRVVAVHTAQHANCTVASTSATATTTPSNPSDCETKKNCYVDVEEADDGKWPDVCGSTETAGQLQKRRLYKTGEFPQNGIDALNALNNWTHSCEDPGLNACELSTWSTLQYYRPSEDVRQGN